MNKDKLKNINDEIFNEEIILEMMKDNYFDRNIIDEKIKYINKLKNERKNIK